MFAYSRLTNMSMALNTCFKIWNVLVAHGYSCKCVVGSAYRRHLWALDRFSIVRFYNGIWWTILKEIAIVK